MSEIYLKEKINKYLDDAKNGSDRMLSILERAKEYVLCDRPCIISIDGRSASGKTTLAQNLNTVLDADVIHMDDFFLPTNLRTEQRLGEAGGNIHYERFIEEVLPFISSKNPFSYRIFDCKTMDYSGIGKYTGKQFIIIEGAYSHHPKFGKYADIKVFSDIKPNEQIERIRKRNGEEKLKIFQSKWIPMEEKYFTYYSIENNADIIL